MILAVDKVSGYSLNGSTFAGTEECSDGIAFALPDNPYDPFVIV